MEGNSKDLFNARRSDAGFSRKRDFPISLAEAGVAVLYAFLPINERHDRWLAVNLLPKRRKSGTIHEF